LIELNIKDFILTDTSSLRITSVQVFGVDDVKTPKQDLQFHFSHPFCKTLPKVLSDIWKSARNAVQDEPLPIQENSIIDDTLGDSGFGLGADFMGNNTVHDFSVEVMRGADLGDSFAAFRDSMTPVRANRSSLASRRPSLSSNGDLSSEAETANRDRLSLGPRLSDASFNLGGLIKPNDGGNASEDVDQQRRSQSFAEQVGLLASRQSRVQFHQLFSGNASRAEAADSFYQLLLLTQRGQLLVHQSQPYAPIDIQIVITAE
jgi:hypothetical protein